MAADSVNVPEGYSLDQSGPSVPAGYTLDPETSVTGSLGRGALDAVPFGTKGAAAAESALGSESYDKYLKELDQLLAADKEQHPVAHDVGEVAGSVAPFAIPGVGEALGAESIAGRAGVGAGLGALQAASNNRDTSQLPTDLLKGAATGAVLNPAVGGITDALANGLSQSAPKLENLANAKAVQSMGFKPGVLGLPEEELNKLGQQIRDWDLANGDTQERLQKAQVLSKVVGAKIGDIGAGASPLADATPFTDPLQQAAEQSAKFFGPEGNADLNTYRQGIANIQNNGKDFDSLQALKSAYGDKAFDGNGQVANPAAAKVYGQIKNAMKSIVAEAPEEYQKAMTNYGTLKDITYGLQKQLQSEQANGVQAKGFGMAGKLGGMLLGGNPEATTGAAAALAASHPFVAMGVASTLTQNPELMSNLAGNAAKGATSLAGNLGSVAPAATNAATSALQAPKIPPAYHPVFQQATKGLTDPADIAKQTTITDFVLQSRDPNYVKAKQELADADQ